MPYQEPRLQSSFAINNLGETIYNKTLELNPALVVEFGALHGYSTHSLIQALGELGGQRTLVSVDLFEDYPYNNCTQQQYGSNLSALIECLPSVSHVVIKSDIISNLPELSRLYPSPDLLFVDISNDGGKLIKICEYYNCPIMFEGGTSERDSVQWMIDYGMKPISSIRQKGINFTVIDERFPSLSLTNA